jgi:hypothetical protein
MLWYCTTRDGHHMPKATGHKVRNYPRMHQINPISNFKDCIIYIKMHGDVCD